MISINHHGFYHIHILGIKLGFARRENLNEKERSLKLKEFAVRSEVRVLMRVDGKAPVPDNLPKWKKAVWVHELQQLEMEKSSCKKS